MQIWKNWNREIQIHLEARRGYSRGRGDVILASLAMIRFQLNRRHPYNLTTPDKFKPFTDIPEADLKSMASIFASTFDDFPPFESNTIYADTIFKCYNDFRNWSTLFPDVEQHCLNPLSCEKPEILDFRCSVARKDYQKVRLSDDLVLHHPISKYYWWKNERGCRVFLNTKFSEGFGEIWIKFIFIDSEFL